MAAILDYEDYEELGYTAVLSKIALHGGGHIELNKMHKRDF